MKKIIILGLVFLFVGMVFQPAFANIIDNSPPEPPTITGPNSGKSGQTLTYTFNAGDPFWWSVRFHIDWGDGHEEWTTYVPSERDISVSHIWDVDDIYTITAYTQNKVGENSTNATKQITIPRNKQEDCDCQTDVSDIGLNNLNKDSEPNCGIIITRMFLLGIRMITLGSLLEVLHSNGILYKIVYSRIEYLIQIWDMLYELNVEYDCGWPEFPELRYP